MTRTQKAQTRAQLNKKMGPRIDGYMAGKPDQLATDKEQPLARRSAAACSGWVGRLFHDRSKYADWGWLRDEAGELIVIVKIPPLTDDEINKHRRAGTDPAQARVDAILAAINGQNV